MSSRSIQNGVTAVGTQQYLKNAKEEEEEEKYQVQRHNDNVVNQLIKTLPTKQAGIISSMSRLALTGPSASAVSTASPGLRDALLKSGAGSAIGPLLAALTVTSQLGNVPKAALDQDRNNRYLKSAYGNMQGGITAGAGANNGLLLNGAKNIGRASGTLAAGSTIMDALSGKLLTEGLSSTTKGLMGVANPAFGIMNANGGIGAVGAGINAKTGLTAMAGINPVSGLATGLDFATGMGGMMLLTKGLGAISSKIQEMDPNNPKNAKNNRFPIDFRTRPRASDDPMAMSEFMRMNSMIKTLGPNGMGALTLAESIEIGLLNKISLGTSGIAVLIDLFQSYADANEKTTNNGNKGINDFQDAFGKQKNTGEFDTLLKDGKPTLAAEFAMGFSNFSNSIGSLLNPGNIAKLFNTDDINSSRWALREARQAGDKTSPLKETAKKHNISIQGMNLITMDIETVLAGTEDKALVLALYSAKLQRLSTEKLVEIAKNSVGKDGKPNETIGAMQERLQREKDQEVMKSHSMFIDGFIKPIDDLIAKTPGLKILSSVGHAATSIGKGIAAITSFDGYSRMKGYFSDLYKESRDKFVSDRMDPRAKNEEDLRNAAGMVDVSLEQQFYSYMVNVFPNEFQKLLAAVGVENAAKLAVDRYSGDWVEQAELEARNTKRHNDFMDIVSTDMPQDDSFFSWVGDKFTKMSYGLNSDEAMTGAIQELANREYKFTGKMNDDLNANNVTTQYDEALLKARNGPEPITINTIDYTEHLTGMDLQLASLLDVAKAGNIITGAIFNRMADCCNPTTNNGQSDEDKIKNRTVSVNSLIDARAKEDRAKLSLELSKANLPYLEKIFTLLEDNFKRTAPKKTLEETPKNEMAESGIIEDLLGFFGFGDKDKKNKTKVPKGALAVGAGAIFTSIAGWGASILAGLVAVITSPAWLTGIALAITAAAVGATVYKYWDEIKNVFSPETRQENAEENNNALVKNYNDSTIKRLEDRLAVAETSMDMEKILNSTNTDISTPEVRDFIASKKKENAQMLNDESYKKYGIDINSFDMLNYADQIKNLSTEALVKLKQDTAILNKVEDPINKEEEEIRKNINKLLTDSLANAIQQQVQVTKMDKEEKDEYMKLHPKFDSLLEALQEIKVVNDPSKTNNTLLSGLAELQGISMSGITAVSKGIEEIAANVNIASRKLIENSIHDNVFELNYNISSAIPSLNINTKEN